MDTMKHNYNQLMETFRTKLIRRPCQNVKGYYKNDLGVSTDRDPKILNLLFGLFCLGNAQDFVPLFGRSTTFFTGKDE